MLPFFANVLQPSGLAIAVAGRFGLKPIKYCIDSLFRDKVEPVPGSVLYCDLWVAAEHSGIYLGEGQISNIEVTAFAEGTVTRCNPRSFTSKSVLGRKIYVSCDRDGAVGHPSVARGADAHVGERAFYGLVFKNCHEFSNKCVNYVQRVNADGSLLDAVQSALSMDTVDETWEPTLANLKAAAKKKLGATKWRLWDWDSEVGNPSQPEPDWRAHAAFFENQPLNDQTISHIRAELHATQAYEAEIADENIPDHIRRRLADFRKTLESISHKYDEVKGFLASCPGANLTYADLKECNEDFSALANALQGNASIRELARKMGRSYISTEKKKQIKVPQASKSEVYGTHRSDDVMRVLPSELLNLKDETLENLFYARLLEKNLLSYELQGVTFARGEGTESSRKRTGPVVACLDTSGSMQGPPLLKAKALLIAIANILKQEGRSLHVLLFGSSGELREFSMAERSDMPGLLKFLREGFNGGTDFETPLQRAFEIITAHTDYLKADVLMISDGDCSLSPTYLTSLKSQKEILDCMVYSVLCAGSRVADEFSDEVVVI